MSTATMAAPAKPEKVLENAFKANNISHNQRDLELARDIVKHSQEKQYSAYKAAIEICNYLEIEAPFNATIIEQALIESKLLKSK